MKRILFVASFSVAALVVLGQLGCQQATPEANRASENVNSRKEPVVDNATIEKDLLQLERDWSTAAVTHNADAVKRVEADDIIVTYPDGTTGTKADDMRDIETGALTAEGWDLADVKVKVLSQDCAIVTGRGIIKNGKYKGPDGRVQELKPQYRFTDTFARRNGQWQVVSSHSTTILNPPALPSPTAQSFPSATQSPSPAQK